MIRLIFDSATNLMYVGLIIENELVDHTIRVARQDHAKYLVDRIDQLLKRNSLTIDDVNEIIVGVGPGSYTGIRISVTVAKSLGYAKNINVRSVSSLLFLSSGYQGITCAMIDAKRGFVFVSIYQDDKLLLQDSYIKLDELSTNPFYKQATHVFVNDETYKIDINKIIKSSKLIDDIHNLVPNYLRKTEAENNL